MGTDYLFARPNFIGGMASSVDLGCILVSEYNRSNTPQEADFRALLADWKVVGKDISSAMNQLDLAYEQK